MGKQTENKSVFETLNSINVNDKTEKKNGLTYLSWAWAWGELLKHYPESTYTVYENDLGYNYHTDGKTCWVKTGVTVEGKELIEYLPVMDFRNKSIPTDQVTSFEVNKTIQRSLTKAIARHGLGLYIFSGEDLPESEGKVTKTAAPSAPSKPANDKPYLNKGTESYNKVVKALTEKKATLDQVQLKYKLSSVLKKELNDIRGGG